MIKRSFLFIVLTLLIVLLLTGCGGEEAEFVDASGNNVFTVTPDVSSNQSTSANTSTAQGTDQGAVTETPAGGTDGTAQTTAGMDVDLASMNSTMMIAMIENIYSNPADYIGGTIKMEGEYFVDYDPQAKQLHHYIIYFDESACCSYGFEFRLTEGSGSADDFPKNGTKIGIEGIFTRYSDTGGTWHFLEADDFTVLR